MHIPNISHRTKSTKPRLSYQIRQNIQEKICKREERAPGLVVIRPNRDEASKDMKNPPSRNFVLCLLFYV